MALNRSSPYLRENEMSWHVWCEMGGDPRGIFLGVVVSLREGGDLVNKNALLFFVTLEKIRSNWPLIERGKKIEISSTGTRFSVGTVQTTFLPWKILFENMGLSYVYVIELTSTRVKSPVVHIFEPSLHDVIINFYTFLLNRGKMKLNL